MENYKAVTLYKNKPYGLVQLSVHDYQIVLNEMGGFLIPPVPSNFKNMNCIYIPITKLEYNTFVYDYTPNPCKGVILAALEASKNGHDYVNKDITFTSKIEPSIKF